MPADTPWVALQGIRRRRLPDNHRALLTSYGQYLSKLAELTVPASRHVADGPGLFVLYAMFVHLVQLARAVQELCIDGYAIEAQMLGRAMVGQVLDMLLIAEKDSDRRSLLFALFQKRVRRERAMALVRYGHVTKERMAELESEQLRIEKEALEKHAKVGTKPAARLGKSRNSWSGLSTRVLSRRFDRPGWYDLFYSPFSDVAHANAAAVADDVALIARGEVVLGGRFADPWLVVVAASEAMSAASEAIDTIFKLRNRTARDTEDERMKAALVGHATSLRAARKSQRAGRRMGDESLGQPVKTS